MADSGTLYLRAAAMMIMTMTDGYYHDGWAGNRLCLRSIRLQLPCRACLCALHCVGWVDGFSLRGNRRQSVGPLLINKHGGLAVRHHVPVDIDLDFHPLVNASIYRADQFPSHTFKR